jgi:hypothetical protein
LTVGALNPHGTTPVRGLGTAAILRPGGAKCNSQGVGRRINWEFPDER